MDRIRYSRQIKIPAVGEGGQRKLLASKVFIVGCGALGSMVAMQLAGAGVGHIMISDFDTIDISNLQRQFFFMTSEAGLRKSDVLGGRMISLNPDIEVTFMDCLIGRREAENLFAGCDYIVDATDNPASKLIVEDVCMKLGKPCCIGGVDGFRGQVVNLLPGHTGFAELMGESMEDGGVMPCAVNGVLGPAAALCASIQAAAAIKSLIGTGDFSESGMVVFDLLECEFKTFRF